jgi:hypothetical protein
VAQRDRAADMAMTGSLIGSGVSMMSDIRAKENIRPASAASIIERLDETYGREEADVGPGGPRVDMRQASSNAYDYKDPSMGAGSHVGPMAQELEQTAAAGAVTTGPDGMKRVDPGRLTMVNTSAIGEQQRRLDRLESVANGQGGAMDRVHARGAQGGAPQVWDGTGPTRGDIAKYMSTGKSDVAVSDDDVAAYEQEQSALKHDLADQRSIDASRRQPSAEERDRRMMTFGGVGSLRPQDAAILEQRYPKPKKPGTEPARRRIKGERA